MKFSASQLLLCAMCLFVVRADDAAPVTAPPVTGPPVTSAPVSSANGDNFQLMTAAGIITLGAAALGL
eukprot:CAMPEP_0178916488 /NCGR_PEP_ID=MMETSP0786-20121207/12672_1 /TAXON_ID=186022 /ORGANISM="Thalassionema frauenfeldii, Strain CCMP 1798" /LENGTH=67 /DNA_ID=CAMNT_0020589839 /DNA_START=119 /DNA_END=322 /DNA_ORIENTATION=+